MLCYKCRSELNDSDYCPKCDAYVKTYKKIARLSNAYYNRGLAKAKVRDLSGAAEDLTMSVKLDKHNTKARNLLGLVNTEMGDIVEGLSQWVLSMNIDSEDKVASAYVKKVESNMTQFELITGAIKKYNLSLNYVKEENYDMAIIQLKKVVSQNPKLIKAMQLLALLYYKEEEYAKAKKLILQTLRIDCNNTRSLYYLKEIESAADKKREQSAGSFLPIRRKTEKSNKPLTGNESIVPKSTYKEPSNGAITIIYILLGAVIGAAMIWFLVTPARYKGLTSDYTKSLAEYSEQLSNGNVELNTLTEELASVKKENGDLQTKLAEITGTEGSNKLLNSVIKAAASYISNDMTKAAEYLLEAEVSSLPTDEAKALYNTISAGSFATAASSFYTSGQTEYNKSNYSVAVEYFVKAFKCDGNNVNSAYYAAKCYVALDQVDNAKKYYGYVVSDFATSGYYNEANTYINTH